MYPTQASTMRVVAIILALAAGASAGCSCPLIEDEDQCTNTCSGCVWYEQCGRRNLRFGAAVTGCCAYECRRKLTAEETAALSVEQLEERRRLC